MVTELLHISFTILKFELAWKSMMSVLVKEVPKAIANQLLLGTVTYSFIYLLKGSQKYYKAEFLRSKTVGVTALEFEFI